MPVSKDRETTFLARTNFRGTDRVFGIKTRDRRQHTYVIGKTGTGKTVLLKNMALQDIHAGHGVCIIDPHGEFVEEVLAKIPPERVNDVVYFNPVDSEYPIGFNVFEVQDARYKHLVVSDLLGIFTKIWANVWSARMEYILQNCILALLDTPGTTLLGIPRILVDKDYREKIISRVQDPVVRSFWVHEYETWRDQFRNEAIVPIQNKVGQFLNTSFIRNIVGQETSTMNIADIMNTGKILLVNVSKGRIGEDNSQLLGAMIITKMQLAAMERVRIPEEERKDFYLYVDEFQNFATDSFASILSEARKYRLDLILAHQYVGQLVTDTSTKVKDAVFGNVGTMIVFRVGADDAEMMEKEFEPEFMLQDLVNLPNHHVYLKLMVDGVTSRPFSAATLAPLKFGEDPMMKEKIMRVSRERYARPRAEVEEAILRWSGMRGDGAGVDQDDGKMHETVCWNCGKTASVPFKPDGKRPVYCQSCMKQIEEGKLIPLPERMPQLGRNRFGDTLGELGIEFPAPEAAARSVARSRGDIGRYAAPRPRAGSMMRPMIRQMERREAFPQSGNASRLRPAPGRGDAVSREKVSRLAASAISAGGSEGTVPRERVSYTQRTAISAAGRPIRSQPVLRGVPGQKPVSLAQLARERSDGTGRVRPGEGRGSAGDRPVPAGPDVAGLRHTIQQAMRTNMKSAAPQNILSAEKEKKKNVMRPGDAVRF